jgi:cell division protein FtsZ
MTINLRALEVQELKPRITVLGVGGAGGNAVNNMITAKLEGVSFVVANTDAQALAQSKAQHRIQLGAKLTEGLGAGAKPDVGRGAAEESLDEILEHLSDAHMVFITAGMGGGTGTGAAPVIARAVRERGVLTVGVVTKPFHFEGDKRMRVAERGIDELQSYVDTLIIIPNQNLFRVATERTTFAQAFAMADDVLHSGVRGVTDLIVMPGLINRDFADIKTVMSEMGKAMMGTGEMEGEGRALRAAEAAISNPLLDDVSMRGARAVLINVTGGPDLMLFEVDEAVNRIRAEVDSDANILFGSALSETMEGRVRVSVVATGIDAEAMARPTADNVQRLHPRPKPVVVEAPATVTSRAQPEPVAVSISTQMESALHEMELPPDPISDSRIFGTSAVLAEGQPEEPLTLGGAEAPMLETPPQIEVQPLRDFRAPAEPQPKRRGFGLFGRRPRAEPRERVEPALTIQREPAAPEVPSRAQVAPSAPARAAEPARAPQQPASDLFAGVAEDDRFEIPAFLRRQANTGT